MEISKDRSGSCGNNYAYRVADYSQLEYCFPTILARHGEEVIWIPEYQLFRLGTILEAEKVEKADKLLKLLVDTGLDKRTIVSGIAKHYKPEDIIGKTVTVLMNLPPRKIRGVESQGMILMAENEDNELSFVSPEKDFEAGCGIH